MKRNLSLFRLIAGVLIAKAKSKKNHSACDYIKTNYETFIFVRVEMVCEGFDHVGLSKFVELSYS